MKVIFHLILVVSVCLAGRQVRAQGDESDLEMIEAEIEKGKPVEKREKPRTDRELKRGKAENVEPDLKTISPADEVSVIQKRFMPKTKRFQFFGGGTWMTNDPWYWNFGLTGKISYNFIESMGVELSALGLTNTGKDSVKDLQNNLSVSTNAIILSKGYFGVDFLWTPIYGKMSLFNQRIIPFDLYFALGGGSTTIENAKATTASTFHGGAGQIFAITKSLGFRWDISWNYFKAQSNSSSEESGYSNIFLSFGANYYIPEVKYR